MNFEQIEKIRKYLLDQGQQELVGHLDGMVGEWRKAQAILAEQLPVVDEPLDEGQTPEPSAEVQTDTPEEHTTAQDFQDNASSQEGSEA